jgi:4-amino-4-deoxy-L-arabinose transferase-like glycosyltransferase
MVPEQMYCMHGLSMKTKGPEFEPTSSRSGSQTRVRGIRGLPLICFIAFGVRLLALGMVQRWPMKEGSPLWRSGPEIVNIAASIASHHGFSSPFGVPTGPTAWIPPVYPYLVAAIFLTLGPRSNLAALSILTVQALFSALTCIPIYGVAKRAFDEDSALWASWGWALFPYAIVIPVLFVWETTLSGLLLTLLCYLCLDLSHARGATLMVIGVIWGIAALTNTALLSVMPVFLLCPYLGKPLRLPFRPIALILLVSTLVVFPWCLRNWRELGAVVPVRSNFGEEFWLGNHEGGTGRIEFGLGPADNERERERYGSMGEISYTAQRRKEAINFISENRFQFLRQTFYRVRYWWFAQGETAGLFIFYRCLALISLAGLALARRNLGNGSVLTILAAIMVYPIIYYLTDVYARYRYPIEPLMIIVAGVAVSQALVFAKRKLGKS